jgi:hypothetical protein
VAGRGFLPVLSTDVDDLRPAEPLENHLKVCESM